MKPRAWMIAGAILAITYGVDLVTEWFGERRVSISNVIYFVFGSFIFVVFWLDLRKTKREDQGVDE